MNVSNPEQEANLKKTNKQTNKLKQKYGLCSFQFFQDGKQDHTN